jgi:hypothetical protein
MDAPMALSLYAHLIADCDTSPDRWLSIDADCQHAGVSTTTALVQALAQSDLADIAGLVSALVGRLSIAEAQLLQRAGPAPAPRGYCEHGLPRGGCMVCTNERKARERAGETAAGIVEVGNE